MARHEPLSERVARLEERLALKLPAIEERLHETAESLTSFSKELAAARSQLSQLLQYGRIGLVLMSAALIHLTGQNVAAQLAGYALKLVSMFFAGKG